MNRKHICLLIISVIFIIFSCKNTDDKTEKNENISEQKQDSTNLREEIEESYYSHYSGFWDTNEEVKLSLKIQKDYISGYLIFVENNLYYELNGVLNVDKTANIQALGLEDSLGFKILIINKNKIEITFYPPQSAEIFYFEVDYEKSKKISCFCVDTIFSATYDDSQFDYSISFHIVSFENEISIEQNDNFLYDEMIGNDNEFFNSILSEKIGGFENSLEFMSVGWYENEYQDVIFNDYNILIIGNYKDAYTGGMSTWSSEKYLILDLKNQKQLCFEDIFNRNKLADFYEFLELNYDILRTKFDFYEPVYFFTNEYFYITFESEGATRTGDIFVRIKNNKLEPYLTTFFKQNILSRF